MKILEDWRKSVLAALISITAIANSAQAETYNVQDVQTWLAQLGYNPGAIDGYYGRKTADALTSFYASQGKQFDGALDQNESDELKLAIDQYFENLYGNYKIKLTPLSEISAIELPDFSDDATIVQGIGVADLFDQGKNDIFLCSTTYRNYADHPVTILAKRQNQLIDVTDMYFSGDVPNVNQCTGPIFSDLNNDGKLDIIYSEAGRDDPPWTGTAIEVAMNEGGSLKRITPSFEDKVTGIRSYATAVGNIDSDPFGEILLSSGTDASKSVVLHFNEDGISIKPNPFFVKNLWWWTNNSTNMQVADFDADGKDDIYFGGNWASENNQIAWSGLRANRFSKLPATPLGHYSGRFQGDRVVHGADITTTAVADFDLDGDLDFVNVYESVSQTFKNGSIVAAVYSDSAIQILENRGDRKFATVLPNFKSELGRRFFLSPIVYDLNHDGKDDIILN